MKRIGIVGCGNIAGTHVWALEQLSDAEMVAFADIRMDRAKLFSEKYTGGKAMAFEELGTMLEQGNLDAVHICTPHWLHVPMALQALEKGVSVFSEKPPAISMEEFERLCEAERNSPGSVGFCFQNRYNKTIEKARQLLESRELGELIGARAFVTWRRDEKYYDSDWKGKLATEGGGALINQTIHTLDLMLSFLGKPKEVRATLSNHHLPGIIQVEDTVEVWMEFARGARACLYGTTAYATDAPVMLELSCEGGSITVMEQNVLLRQPGKELQVWKMEEGTGCGKDYWGSGHLACIRDFYGSLERGEPFRNDLPGVRTTMETMMKIYQYR